MGTIQPDKTATISDDLVRIIEEAHTYTNKLSTHMAISDKHMELMAELDVVNKKINEICYTNTPFHPSNQLWTTNQYQHESSIADLNDFNDDWPANSFDNMQDKENKDWQDLTVLQNIQNQAFDLQNLTLDSINPTNIDDSFQTLDDCESVNKDWLDLPSLFYINEECNTGLGPKNKMKHTENDISPTNSHTKTRDDYEDENLQDFNNEDWLNLSCLFDIHECNTGPKNKMKHKEDDISPTIPHTNADDFSQTLNDDSAVFLYIMVLMALILIQIMPVKNESKQTNTEPLIQQTNNQQPIKFSRNKDTTNKQKHIQKIISLFFLYYIIQPITTLAGPAPGQDSSIVSC